MILLAPAPYLGPAGIGPVIHRLGFPDGSPLLFNTESSRVPPPAGAPSAIEKVLMARFAQRFFFL